jgi:hypothetical protein
VRASVHLSWQHTKVDAAWTIRRAALDAGLRPGLLGFLAVYFVLTMGLSLGRDAHPQRVEGTLWAWMTCVALGTGAAGAVAGARGAAGAADWCLGATRVVADPRGLVWQDERGVSAWRWAAVTRWDPSARGVTIQLHNGQRRWIPARALSPGDRDALAELRANPLDAGDDFGPPRPVGGVRSVEGVWTVDHWAAALPSVAEDRGLRMRAIEAGGMLVAGNTTVELAAGGPAVQQLLISVLVLVWTSGSLLVARLRAWWAIARVHRLARRNPSQLPLGPFALVAGPEGLWVRSSHGARQVAWSAEQVVEPLAEIVVLRQGGGATLVVPRSCLAEPDAFVAQLQSWIAAAGERRDGGPAPGRGTADDANPFAAPGGGR